MGIAYTDTVMGIVLHTLVALGYASLAVRPWFAMAGHGPSETHWLERWGLALVLLLHAYTLYHTMALPGGLRLGLGLALSSTLWLGMTVYWFESLMIRVDAIRLLLLPAAALGALMPLLLPQGTVVQHLDTPWLAPHLVLSLAAYGFMVIAAAHALLMAAIDRHLHQPQTSTQGAPQAAWARLLDTMPPLLVLESVLFRLIAIGFVLLTLSMLSGAAMSLALGGSALPFDHKTLFTLLSWATFGVLLLGRQLRGWRGRIAVRYTLAGLILLVLAYAGSRFVLEVVLQR